MKRFTVLFLLLALLLSACSTLSPSQQGDLPDGGTVRMTTQFSVYEKDTACIQVALHNDSSGTLYFGSAWQMEVNRNGEWMVIPFRENICFEELLYTISPGGTHVFTVHTDALNYRWKNGSYRILKETWDEEDEKAVCAAVFTIGESHVSADSPLGYRPLEQLPLSYDDAQAIKDGVVFVNTLMDGASETVNAFFASYEIGMDTQLRLAIHDDAGNLILEDLLCERLAGTWRIRYRRDETRAGGTITETIYSHIVTDGVNICLACTPAFTENDAVPVALLCGFDWMGHDDVKARLTKASDKAAPDFAHPAYWSPDGETVITLYTDPLTFGITRCVDGGYSGHMSSISQISGMTAIRSAVWEAGSDIALLICDTRTDGMTGYVFYSIPEDTVLSYTASAYGYTIVNGEILIPE